MKEEMKNPRIAVVQFEIKQFDPDANLAKAEKFIREASSKADIIVFPEDFVTGPTMRKKEFVDFDGKYLTHFQKLAKRYSIAIVPGSIIEGDEYGGWYNTTYYIDKKGKVKGRYRKVNLWHPERYSLTPGNQYTVFNTEFGKIGLIICWDLIFPEIFRRMLLRGVNIVICPSFWCKSDAGIGIKHNPNSEQVLVNSLCQARAFENEIVMVYSNAAGNFTASKSKDELIGQSQIAIPFKGNLKSLEHNREEMFIQEVNLQVLNDAERVYKIREDLKQRIL